MLIGDIDLLRLKFFFLYDECVRISFALEKERFFFSVLTHFINVIRRVPKRKRF